MVFKKKVNEGKQKPDEMGVPSYKKHNSPDNYVKGKTKHVVSDPLKYAGKIRDENGKRDIGKFSKANVGTSEEIGKPVVKHISEEDRRNMIEIIKEYSDEILSRKRKDLLEIDREIKHKESTERVYENQFYDIINIVKNVISSNKGFTTDMLSHHLNTESIKEAICESSKSLNIRVPNKWKTIVSEDEGADIKWEKLLVDDDVSVPSSVDDEPKNDGDPGEYDEESSDHGVINVSVKKIKEGLSNLETFLSVPLNISKSLFEADVLTSNETIKFYIDRTHAYTSIKDNPDYTHLRYEAMLEEFYKILKAHGIDENTIKMQHKYGYNTQPTVLTFRAPDLFVGKQIQTDIDALGKVKEGGWQLFRVMNATSQNWDESNGWDADMEPRGRAGMLPESKKKVKENDDNPNSSKGWIVNPSGKMGVLNYSPSDNPDAFKITPDVKEFLMHPAIQHAFKYTGYDHEFSEGPQEYIMDMAAAVEAFVHDFNNNSIQDISNLVYDMDYRGGSNAGDYDSLEYTGKQLYFGLVDFYDYWDSDPSVKQEYNKLINESADYPEEEPTEDEFKNIKSNKRLPNWLTKDDTPPDDGIDTNQALDDIKDHVMNNQEAIMRDFQNLGMEGDQQGRNGPIPRAGNAPRNIRRRRPPIGEAKKEVKKGNKPKWLAKESIQVGDRVEWVTKSKLKYSGIIKECGMNGTYQADIGGGSTHTLTPNGKEVIISIKFMFPEENKEVAKDEWYIEPVEVENNVPENTGFDFYSNSAVQPMLSTTGGNVTEGVEEYNYDMKQHFPNWEKKVLPWLEHALTRAGFESGYGTNSWERETKDEIVLDKKLDDNDDLIGVDFVHYVNGREVHRGNYKDLEKYLMSSKLVSESKMSYRAVSKKNPKIVKECFAIKKWQIMY